MVKPHWANPEDFLADILAMSRIMPMNGLWAFRTVDVRATRMESRRFHDVPHRVVGIRVLAFDPHCQSADLHVDVFTAHGY
jgi:hypothetical protein